MPDNYNIVRSQLTARERKQLSRIKDPKRRASLEKRLKSNKAVGRPYDVRRRQLVPGELKRINAQTAGPKREALRKKLSSNNNRGDLIRRLLLTGSERKRISAAAPGKERRDLRHELVRNPLTGPNEHRRFLTGQERNRLSHIKNPHQRANVKKRLMGNNQRGGWVGPPQPKGPKGFKNYIPNDSIFQQQKSGYQKTLEDYLNQNKYQVGNINQTYTTALDRLNQEIPKAHTGILQEAAGRGLLYSGSPLTNTSQYDIQAAQQKADLATSRQQQLEAQKFGRQQTRSTINTNIATARQAAVQRRAIRFGVM